MKRPIELYRFPLTDYQTAWRWQQDAAGIVRRGGDEALALLQHAPVYTLGRRGRAEHLLVSRDILRARGVEVIETNRGGDVTFHGPGQVVGYPILDLRRRGLGPAEYVRTLEAVMIGTLDRFGVSAFRVSGRPGVWTDGGKIGAVGVRIEGGVSLHGFALNVDTDLAWFDAILPCGIADAAVTSMARALGASPGVEAVTDAIAEEFASAFDVSLRATTDRRSGDLQVATVPVEVATSPGEPSYAR